MRRVAETGDLVGCRYTQLTTEAFTYLERLMRRPQSAARSQATAGTGDNRLRQIFRRPIDAFTSKR